MRISFLLPCRTSFPAGGFKIIFEYANRFAAIGYEVNIVMPAVLYTLRNKIAGIIRYPYYKITKNYTPNNWFNLDKRIKCHYIWNLNEKNVPKSDIFVASSVETSYFLKDYKQNCKKFYFIQDFEAWDMTPEQVMTSYSFPLKKITIAPWLLDKIKEAGSDAVLIPNGFDFSYFSLTNDIKSRNKFSILMMYHKDERKRCDDSFAALKIVKERYPNLTIKMFGVPDCPKNVPFAFEYFQKPEKGLHNRLYNEAAIFVASSKAEGMALPPAEAMQCGCALCCTDIGGFALYAKNEKTALLAPVYDIDAISKNIIRLIEDDELRCKIALNGHEYVKQFTWDLAFSNFKKAIEE